MKTYHIPLSARQKNLDHMKLLISDPDFHAEVLKIRKKYPKDYNKATACYASEVTQLCRVKKLPRNFDYYVHQYIAYDIIRAPMTNYNIIPSQDTSFEADVKIYTNLTEPEFKDLQMEVSSIKTLSSFQPLKNIDRRIEDEKVYAEVKKQNENPDKEYIQTVAEFKGKHRAKKIYENARELKELRKNRFGK